MRWVTDIRTVHRINLILEYRQDDRGLAYIYFHVVLAIQFAQQLDSFTNKFHIHYISNKFYTYYIASYQNFCLFSLLKKISKNILIISIFYKKKEY